MTNQQAIPTAPPAPGLIVLSGGATRARSPTPIEIDTKWLSSLPAAGRVLAVGRDATAMAGAHRARHPRAIWHGLALPGDDAGPMPAALDGWTNWDDASLPDGFDLLIVSTEIVRLPSPLQALRRWSCRCVPGSILVAAIDNASSVTHIGRLIQGDESANDGARETDAPAIPPATFYKLLLDAGWMPSMVDHHPCLPMGDRVASALRATAEAFDVAAGSTDFVHRTRRLIVAARRDLATCEGFDGPANFCVVVPTTSERQLRANVERSPGLREVDAPIVSCRRALNPADALARALPHCDRDWVLFCHQDVYFPAGFGHQLAALLAAIPSAERATTLLGFVGIGIDRASRAPVPAGHVIDRLHRADHPASDAALSIDELAIVVARNSVHRIDPEIGWHLWATDLCLTAIDRHQVFPRIVRAPIFHNSHTGWALPDAFLDATERLLAKHAQFVPIHTLCGALDPAFVAGHRSKVA